MECMHEQRVIANPKIKNVGETEFYWKGISSQRVRPNRWPYLWEGRPHNTLYGVEKSTKPFPYTDLNRVEYPTCAGFIPCPSVLQECNLRGKDIPVGWWTCDGYIYH